MWSQLDLFDRSFLHPTTMSTTVNKRNITWLLWETSGRFIKQPPFFPCQTKTHTHRLTKKMEIFSNLLKAFVCLFSSMPFDCMGESRCAPATRVPQFNCSKSQGRKFNSMQSWMKVCFCFFFALHFFHPHTKKAIFSITSFVTVSIPREINSIFFFRVFVCQSANSNNKTVFFSRFCFARINKSGLSF